MYQIDFRWVKRQLTLFGKRGGLKTLDDFIERLNAQLDDLQENAVEVFEKVQEDIDNIQARINRYYMHYTKGIRKVIYREQTASNFRSLIEQLEEKINGLLVELNESLSVDEVYDIQEPDFGSGSLSYVDDIDGGEARD